MSQADVQSLVSLLSNGQADPSLFPIFFNDAMNILGGADWHTIATPVKFTAGVNTVALSPGLLHLISVVYDDTVLSELTLRELEALTTGWRNTSGNPVAYTTETETAKTIALFQTPAQTSPLIIPVHGLPIGEDYTPGNGFSIHSEYRADPLPILTLPIALIVLTREYSRESDHQDFAMAGACKALASVLLGMLR
jgi:hypothetical protein